MRMGLPDSVRVRLLSVPMGWLPYTRCFGLKRWLMRAAGLEIAPGVRMFSDVRFLLPQVSIGADTWIGPACFFVPAPQAPIRVGARCDIAPQCTLITGTHDIGPPHRRAGEGKILPITIGDGTWVGARSLILGGVTIGTGCVIAAGAVVTQDIPDNTLAGGVPAKPIRPLDA